MHVAPRVHAENECNERISFQFARSHDVSIGAYRSNLASTERRMLLNRYLPCTGTCHRLVATTGSGAVQHLDVANEAQ